MISKNLTLNNDMSIRVTKFDNESNVIPFPTTITAQESNERYSIVCLNKEQTKELIKILLETL